MGYQLHHAIVVTSWSGDAIDTAAHMARQIGLECLGPSLSAVNGYRTILVCPDGSKEGWQESDDGDARRVEFRRWLEKKTYDDGSSNLEWVEIAYGNDDAAAIITDHAWMTTDAGQGDAP